jgi:5-formyltetrahydrofolate cyclo-ligase
VAILDKAALRADMRRRRVLLSRENPDAAGEAATHAPLALIVRVVAGYWPIGSEIDPWPLLRRFEAAGARLALPVVTAADAPLAFRLWRDGDDLAADALGLLAPTEPGAAVCPDVIIAPVLAFDRRGGRLGQGGGYFDRTLAALRAAGPILVIGLAFAGQETEAVPFEPHDQRLDAILTERGYFEVS